ncbi:heparinase [Dysgonomonas sp. 520]|nr:heparinase [Dysgonomonas sp. 520]
MLTVIAAFFSASLFAANEHPCLILSKDGVAKIKRETGKVPLFDKTLSAAKSEIDLIVNSPIDVPAPKDAGGGYTHERHKKNYNEMYKAGVLYQLYGDQKYALFIKNMLNEYAKMYPTLPLHPVQKSKYRGKLFWQGLNECVWLVHTAQAYDCVYDYLTAKERENIEKNLFVPMVKFIAEDNYETFNKIHNHGTWAVAGVGMIGYVTGNKDWVEKSLYGSEKDKKTGFLMQINKLFSPDGYFTEGPYYQRYSLQPFIVFAQAIEKNQPELKIFEYRNQILSKAVHTSLQLAYTDGQFFHLNDALDKTWHSIEIVYGVDIIYNKTKDNSLLAIAKEQGQVILGDAGIEVAKAIAENRSEPFGQKTILIRDGANGDEGGIGILRMGDSSDQTALVFKATAQGMGHGHFDKLSISYYDNGKEILQDYGAARFLNIEPKNGGHYLPENDDWAKQTIAHNTLVVDETSNYGGKLNIAEKHSPTITGFYDGKDIKAVSAIETNAYSGVEMNRTLLMIQPEGFSKPLVLDVYDVDSESDHQYDLSFYYMGQLMSTDIKYTAHTTQRTQLGTKNGYQYLWKEAESAENMEGNNVYMTFLNGNRFYSITTVNNNNNRYFFNRIGANDPNFNLRNEPSFMIRNNGSKATFVSVIEAHGEFNPREEYTIQPYSNIKSVSYANHNADKQINIETKDNKTVTVSIKDGAYSVKVK